MRARETRVREVKDTGAEKRVTDTELRVQIRVPGATDPRSHLGATHPNIHTPCRTKVHKTLS